MNSIVTVKELHYGVCELDVNRVIALMPKARILIFESAFWTLNEQEDFDKVSELWHKLKGGGV